MRAAGWISVGATLAVCGVVAALLLPSVPGDAPPESAPRTRLTLAIELDKRVYARAETVTATLRLTNTGSVPAERVVVDCDPGTAITKDMFTTFLAPGKEDQIWLDTNGFGDPGVLAPGESHTGTATGVVTTSAHNLGVVAVLCAVTSPSIEQVHVSETAAAVGGASFGVSGRFSVCRNGRHDAPAAGMTVTLEGNFLLEPPPPPPSTVTDAEGRFTFPAVPAGPYQLYFTPLAGHRAAIADQGNYFELLVTSEGVQWQAEPWVTTTDPATACE